MRFLADLSVYTFEIFVFILLYDHVCAMLCIMCIMLCICVSLSGLGSVVRLDRIEFKKQIAPTCSKYRIRIQGTMEMKSALHAYIRKQRQKRKEEVEQDEALRNERQRLAEKKLRDQHTLEEVNQQIAQLEKKLTESKQEKHDLFAQLKKVLHQEDEQRKRVQQIQQQHAKDASEVLAKVGPAAIPPPLPAMLAPSGVEEFHHHPQHPHQQQQHYQQQQQQAPQLQAPPPPSAAPSSYVQQQLAAAVTIAQQIQQQLITTSHQSIAAIGQQQASMGGASSTTAAPISVISVSRVDYDRCMNMIVKGRRDPRVRVSRAVVGNYHSGDPPARIDIGGDRRSESATMESRKNREESNRKNDQDRSDRDRRSREDRRSPPSSKYPIREDYHRPTIDRRRDRPSKYPLRDDDHRDHRSRSSRKSDEARSLEPPVSARDRTRDRSSSKYGGNRSRSDRESSSKRSRSIDDRKAVSRTKRVKDDKNKRQRSPSPNQKAVEAGAYSAFFSPSKRVVTSYQRSPYQASSTYATPSAEMHSPPITISTPTAAAAAVQRQVSSSSGGMLSPGASSTQSQQQQQLQYQSYLPAGGAGVGQSSTGQQQSTASSIMHQVRSQFRAPQQDASGSSQQGPQSQRSSGSSHPTPAGIPVIPAQKRMGSITSGYPVHKSSTGQPQAQAQPQQQGQQQAQPQPGGFQQQQQRQPFNPRGPPSFPQSGHRYM